MPFIGNQPALAYTSFAKQDFTTSATTSYTLDNPVANANELALFINFVRQEPTTAYSASGTTLTLTSATASTDDMYCVYLGQALQTVNPPNASVGLSQLTATGTKNATTFLRGDNTFSVPAGGANTPAFFAYSTSEQSVTSQVYTKVQFPTEEFDTDNAFDNSTNYRFTVPSGKGGKYFFHGGFSARSTNNDVYVAIIGLFKNGSVFSGQRMNSNSTSSAQFRGFGVSISAILDLSVGDYIEIHGMIYGTSPLFSNEGQKEIFFGGYKLIT
ncbi:hypothetical protein N9O38_00950 [Flavobacteriaceae bacterium]|nr:hypothetical protein [Flavobacteriaceae bacterium]